ncbi:MAG TPA: type III restriction endonuclease subunit M [Dialister sp.]|nr:type III restriction endonuclease subunit M [Dialister sp.]
MPTLEWIGKSKVINHHQDVPFRVLERKYSFDENGQHEADNGSENMIIRGDNLEALKALLPRYEGRVKCIYIDPPYNTAKSSEKNKAWVYSDNVDDPRIKRWLNETVGDEGEDLTRHDKWLCMMYPRLKLLYKLLAQDGIIFISIDDNESHNLRFICDEIFGRKSFIAQIVWRSDGNFDNQAKIKNCHEYIICYIKNPDLVGLPNGIDPNVTEGSKIFRSEVRNTLVKNGPKNPMSKVLLPKGFPCTVDELVIEKRNNAFPYYYQKAIISKGVLQNDVEVESGWSSKNILINFINNGFQPVLDTKGQSTVFEITKTGAIEMVKKRTSISHVLSVISNLGSTQNMSSELATMGIKFDFPKPTALIQYLLGFYCEEDSIVLDSFAGSGTTAHAVLNMNKADGGNRQFIIVEMMDYAEDITAKRAKCVIKGYGEGKNAVEGTGGNFSFYDLGEPLLMGDCLNEAVAPEKIREYIWFMETKQPYAPPSGGNPYYLGKHNSTGYYFYYEPQRVTVLDYAFLSTITEKADGTVIYADRCAISEDKLAKMGVTFKKIPRDISKL